MLNKASDARNIFGGEELFDKVLWQSLYKVFVRFDWEFFTCNLYVCTTFEMKGNQALN